jgi:hypothetical protein
MGFPKSFKELCTPSYLYLAISSLALILTYVQNWRNRNHYSLGSFHCKVPNTLFMFFIKVVGILFWTYILNLICKDGNKLLSWILVLFPFVVFLFLIMVMKMNMN